MNWKNLTSASQLAEIVAASFEQPQLVFKHSTRCGISLHAKARLEEAADALNAHFALHYLDLLQFRAISNQISDSWKVIHQSPQVILIQNGEVLYHTSHQGIQAQTLLAKLA